MNLEKRFGLMTENTSVKTLTAFFWYNGIPVRESDSKNLLRSILAQKEERFYLNSWILKKIQREGINIDERYIIDPMLVYSYADIELEYLKSLFLERFNKFNRGGNYFSAQEKAFRIQIQYEFSFVHYNKEAKVYLCESLDDAKRNYLRILFDQISDARKEELKREFFGYIGE